MRLLVDEDLQMVKDFFDTVAEIVVNLFHLALSSWPDIVEVQRAVEIFGAR